VSGAQVTTYTRQENSSAATEFKRIVNYLLLNEFRERVLDELMAKFGMREKELFGRYYIPINKLELLKDGGMLIGAHDATHRVLSTLSISDQHSEIARSFAFLDRVLSPQPARTFCYPFAAPHAFTRDTEILLETAGAAVAFSVEPRDITEHDIVSRPFSLPRFDCNQLPFGSASGSV